MADVPLVKSPVPLTELAGADVATDGQVPTADGAGGVAWETPSGGGATSGAWTAYTPTWTATSGTNPSIGNGTITAAYRQDGKTLFLRVQIIMGSTTTFGTATWRIGLPSGMTSAGARMPLAASAFDSSANQRKAGSAQIGPSGTEMLVVMDGELVATVPWTWASGDQLLIAGVIEIA